MPIKYYSDDLYGVLSNSAGGISKKYYHTFCGTSHLFLALFGFLSVNKDTERYKATYGTLRESINAYGVDGKKFEKAMLDVFPAGTAPAPGEEFVITPDREYNAVNNELVANAIKLKRQMEIEDLIMSLFGDSSYSIFRIFSSIIGSDQKTQEMYDLIIKKFKKATNKKVTELEEIGEMTNLNEWVSKHPQTVVGADDNVDKIEMALSGRSIRNAVLTGPAGVGKTSYIYEFAQRINSGDVPDQFADKIIYQLDPGALLAGTRYRGDFEEKLMNILNIVKEHPEVIIFIDEIHTIINLGGSGDDGGSSQGAGNILKPFITRGEIQIIGCTTNEEYTKYFKADKAFERRFHEIKIGEPSAEDTKKILKGLLPVETEYFKRDIQDVLLDKVIYLSQRYGLDQANPAKAINMLELACAYASVFEAKKDPVNVDDVIESVKMKYNIYISKDKYSDTKKELFNVLLGQDKALNQVCRDLQIVDYGIVDKDKPSASFLFAGPTGTGKTETAKIIARCFFGGEDNLVKINCGEYSTESDVTKLTGSSAGFIGYDDEPALIKGVRAHPNCVVLFDEIEKAHPAVQKVLLNILDTGEMKDNKGNSVSFRNCIIIFTTNLGCNKDTGKSTGLGLMKFKDDTTNEINSAIMNYFSPEFLGRLDDIIYYQGLTNDIAKQLITRYYNEYVAGKNITAQFTPDDINEIIKNSEIETQGARGMKKAVKKQLVKAITRSKEILASTDF